MEVVAFVFVVGCFVLLMWSRGAFDPDRQPAVAERHDRWEARPPSELPADYCPERDGWPADDSPRWRLGRWGRPGTGGDGMLIVAGGDGGGGCGGGGG